MLRISKSANPWEKIRTKPTTHVPKIRGYPLLTQSTAIPIYVHTYAPLHRTHLQFCTHLLFAISTLSSSRALDNVVGLDLLVVPTDRVPAGLGTYTFIISSIF
jgi:hypothetical protein